MNLRMLLLSTLLACATAAEPAPSARYAGTLEPRWWGLAPGFGENLDDPILEALVLRLDTPIDGEELAIYSAAGATDVTPDAAAAACMYGHATVEGTYSRTEHPFVPGVISGARVVTCSPHEGGPNLAMGDSVTLTGTLRKRWWYGPPGWGADPKVDRVNFGAALFVDGKLVPLDFDRSGEHSERSRRFAFACEGQEITVTGTVEPRKPAGSTPPYKLARARPLAACVAPRLDRGRALPPKPLPPAWLD